MSKEKPKIFTKLNLVIGFIASLVTILAWLLGLFNNNSTPSSTPSNIISERPIDKLEYSIEYQAGFNAVTVSYSYFRVTLINKTSKEITNLKGYIKKRFFVNKFESVAITSPFKVSDSLHIGNNNSDATINIASLNPDESIIIHVVSTWDPRGLSGEYEHEHPFEEIYFRAPGVTASPRK
ncbi:MAG: hypothetical protein WCE90_02940 [Candidatus Zixiibacteriota bacterium]